MADDEKQLEELETLEALFELDRELIYNRRPKKIPLWQEHEEEENGITNDEPDKSRFILRLQAEAENLQVVLEVTLPWNYPSASRPYVNALCSKINERRFNTALKDYMNSLDLGSPMIWHITEWAKLEAGNYTDAEQESSQADTEDDVPPVLVVEHARLLIWSHHIYSNAKRAGIVNEAVSLGLRGFLSPGKPGCIIVEGTSEDCSKFWKTIHQWNWAKITLIDRQESHDPKFLRLPAFEEKNWARDNDHKTMQYEQMKAFLDEHGLSSAFHQLLGLRENND
ncbi:RWD domain-containing protein [Aphelenchoides avenae]|nr:RWD domain-containing protein [Aphelenchus avenae]